jgi:hypothetical protein
MDLKLTIIQQPTYLTIELVITKRSHFLRYIFFLRMRTGQVYKMTRYN